ncbi:MAG: ferredoxin [Candidatus Schekmanbacteria bacterium RIFCSPLOWO2_02_FULL_38_14]|uniref:Ferredoxin n=1 Tax=Candidatus Schekmanbacteria bacterium RIFCSPLOWO2_12_FULL_38_15 TaxID=1817883 RepID=A0A1F7SKH1_9BACT|nr:MAG: ferredoxin [Candidatus Schekmanbacteria bacterium RIFCSPLOWO2_02_FULL_38_14]OGL54263.1 MAG: ferredoxin [Candidatus Schekmanbacteria bacterium RIFCSPLOWO2_12_FULL_38_15]
MIETIKSKLNGEPVSLNVDGNRMLLWVLRTDLSITGTKYGCGQGHCGSCTVLVNNKPVKSCTTPVNDVRGKEVITIEGLSKDGNLHPLQKSFIEHNAFQCGYCTSGMILTAYSLLLKNLNPSDREIIEAMDGNLCRCGSHTRIIKAIKSAAKEMKGGKKR